MQETIRDVEIWLVAHLEGKNVVAKNRLCGLGDLQSEVCGIVERNACERLVIVVLVGSLRSDSPRNHFALTSDETLPSMYIISAVKSRVGVSVYRTPSHSQYYRSQAWGYTENASEMD